MTQAPASRTAAEQADLRRWRASLAALITELGLPAAAQAALVDMPKGALEAGLGTVRAATIRKHVREFKKLSAYCKAVSDRAWPKDVGVVLSYFHERHLEPCCRSVPRAIFCCIAFLEKVGGVPNVSRLSDLHLLKNTVNQMQTSTC